uniref:Proteasome activator Blm10 mid region domain-containing protein n=1 Tax=Parascaris equorum TaxID=6256 RepID=A0A914SF49_PAREQ
MTSVQNWANPVAKDIVKMKWHIPDDEELRFAERLIEEFVYKEIHELQSPEKLDK